MKTKRLILVVGSMLIWLFAMVLPAAAFSGLEFNIWDSVTNQPWGSVDGQQYRIIVVDGSTVTYNSGLVMTPSGPPLSFTCDFGVPCPSLPLGNRTIPTPTIGQTVNIYITLDGTTANPATLNFNFDYFGDFGSPYTMNAETGTGPTAVTLSSIHASPAEAPSAAPLTVFVSSVLLTLLILYFRKPRPRRFSIEH